MRARKLLLIATLLLAATAGRSQADRPRSTPLAKFSGAVQRLFRFPTREQQPAVKNVSHTAERPSLFRWLTGKRAKPARTTYQFWFEERPNELPES